MYVAAFSVKSKRLISSRHTFIVLLRWWISGIQKSCIQREIEVSIWHPLATYEDKLICCINTVGTSPKNQLGQPTL
jgi:hypothetical protein